MRQIDCVISSELGLHARPAGLIVKAAGQFESSIAFICQNKQADGKKIFALMGLGAKQGDLVNVVIEGSDEEKAAGALLPILQEYL